MALHTKADWAKLCGMQNGHVKTYTDRGKIRLSGDMIDDKVPENKMFLEKRLAKMSLRAEVVVPVETKLKRVDPKPDLPKYEKPANPSEPDDTYSEMERKEKRLKIEKLEEEIKMSRLKRDKMNGEVIPTDLVELIIREHFKNVTMSFNESLLNVLSDIQKKFDAPRDEIVKFKHLIKEEINKSVTKAKKTTNKALDDLVAEYQVKKGRGEREA